VEEQMAPPSGGVSIPAPPLQFPIRGDDRLVIREIPLREAAAFVAQHHYSKVMPKLNKVVMGLFQEERLVGCITFGWGVRPLDTIKKLFPSLTSKDYLEIGKLCLLDEMPKNTESRFISAAMRFLKQLRPDLKIVFTWADAIWGKPGSIYQASNFWFGGSISSEAYRTSEGFRLHPRQLAKYLVYKGIIKLDAKGRPIKGNYVTGAEVKKSPSLGHSNWAPKESQRKANASGVRRPCPESLKYLGMSHVRGLQFRYVHFLGTAKEVKLLLTESTVLWHRDYPKADDCRWQITDGVSKWHPWFPLEDGGRPFEGAFDTVKK
jgi:hypothetical protein